MKNLKLKKKAILIVCLFLLVSYGTFLTASSVRAAESTALVPTEAFKWYEFGKVNISVSSTSNNPTAGSVLPLKFDIENKTKFPITEGTLYIKIYRERETDTKKDYFKEVATKEELNQGVALVDQFFMAENLAIDKNGKISLSHDYTIPKDSRGGKYKLVAYFQSIRKMNLQGLSFTDDVPGSIFYYQVNNPEQVGAVEFNRGNVKVNGELYDFNSMLKVYGADEDVKISAEISNTTKSTQKISILKSYYSWDGLDEKNNFGNENDSLTLNPGEKKDIELAVPKTTHPVTYVTIKAEWNNNSQSIINVRFARDVAVEARINSIGITEFPLKANDTPNIFISAHEVRQFINFNENGEIIQSENDANQPMYRIEATLKDENQHLLQSYFYEGKLSQEVSGYESSFNSKEDYNYLILEAKLTNLTINKTEDVVAITYYCQNNNFSGCPSNANFSKQGSANISKAETAQKNSFSALINKIIISIIILIILVALTVYLKVNKVIIFVVFVSGSLLALSPLDIPRVSADSVVFTGSPPRFAYKTPTYVKTNYYNYWWTTNFSLSWNATYSAIATLDLAGTVPLPSGSNLNPGDQFYVTDTTHSNPNAIFYNANGGYGDTPYGYFKANAAKDNTRWDTIYSLSYNEMLATSFSFNPLNNMTVGSVTNVFNYNNCSSTSQGAVSSTQDVNAPIKCVASGTPYVWLCTVQPSTLATSGAVKMVYGCTYGAYYYKAWRQGQTNSTAGSCVSRTATCNYYEGLFQTQLGEPGGDPCDIAPIQYQPGPDGCMSPTPPCTTTGPTLCSGGQADYRPIIPQQEITFSYNITQADYTVSLSANPASGDAPLNGVQLLATLTAVPGKSMPTGNTDFTLNCGVGATYTLTNIDVGSSSPIYYTLPQTCNYTAVGNYSASVNVTKGGKTRAASTNINVTAPAPTDTECGTARNQKFCDIAELYALPAGGLCTNGGTPSAIESNAAEESYKWTCTSGSETMHCAARNKCPSQGIWKEVNP